MVGASGPERGGGTAGFGIVVVRRRTVLQDLGRSHSVILDGQGIGKIWAFQMKRYPVSPGGHSIRLAIHGAGTASSRELEFNVDVGEVVRFRTRGRGLKAIFRHSLIYAPYIPGTRSEKIERFYRGPWIVLVEEPRK